MALGRDCRARENVVCECVCVCLICLHCNMCISHSVVSDSAIPWTVDFQALLPVIFPRQEYWSGLPFPPPWSLSDPGLNLALLHYRQIFTIWTTREGVIFKPTLQQVWIFMVDRIMAHIPFKYVTLHGKNDFADLIKDNCDAGEMIS